MLLYDRWFFDWSVIFPPHEKTAVAVIFSTNCFHRLEELIVFQAFRFTFDFPLNLLLVQSHQAKIITLQHLIQGRNNVARVRVEPRSSNQGCKTMSLSFRPRCRLFSEVFLLMRYANFLLSFNFLFSSDATRLHCCCSWLDQWKKRWVYDYVVSCEFEMRKKQNAWKRRDRQQYTV